MKIRCPHEGCNHEIDTLVFEKLPPSRFSKICSWLSRLTKINFIGKIGFKFSKNSVVMKCPNCKLLFKLSRDGQVSLTETDQRRKEINASIKTAKNCWCGN